MTVNIIIEQFDNGISIKWNELDRDVPPKAIVALDRDIARAIGELIWESSKFIMDFNDTNAALIQLNYFSKAIKNNEQERQA